MLVLATTACPAPEEPTEEPAPRLEAVVSYTSQIDGETVCDLVIAWSGTGSADGCPACDFYFPSDTGTGPPRDFHFDVTPSVLFQLACADCVDEPFVRYGDSFAWTSGSSWSWIDATPLWWEGRCDDWHVARLVDAIDTGGEPESVPCGGQTTDVWTVETGHEPVTVTVRGTDQASDADVWAAVVDWSGCLMNEHQYSNDGNYSSRCNGPECYALEFGTQSNAVTIAVIADCDYPVQTPYRLSVVGGDGVGEPLVIANDVNLVIERPRSGLRMTSGRGRIIR